MKLMVKNLSAGYHGKKILDEINMSINSGEVVCLLGPNGSGKTTLFKSILGLIPFDGEIWCDEKQISDLSRFERARLIAYIPQIHIPPFPFTVFDVVLTGRTPYVKMFQMPKNKDREEVYNALEQLQIRHLAHRSYTQLSGGERQMVLIARALAQAPRFLIMDEPTSFLDFGNQLRTIRTIMQLSKKKIGIILTTHVPDHAFMCGSRVIALLNGRIIGAGKPRDTLTNNILNRMYNIDVDIINISENRYMCVPTEGVLV